MRTSIQAAQGFLEVLLIAAELTWENVTELQIGCLSRILYAQTNTGN